MFVDASAIYAILLGEPEAGAFIDALDDAPKKLTSPIAIVEAGLRLFRQSRSDLATVRADLGELLATSAIAVVAIGHAEADAALDAHARFGKGRHPARLNTGDCFAYACARTHGVPLLYKGDDFALTDVTAA